MPTDPFSTGYKGTAGRRRRRNRAAEHQGRLPQPDVPTGDRNRAATERARAARTPRTAAEIPTSVRREHEGRVNQPGVVGKRIFGRALYLPQSPLSGLGLGLEDSINPEVAAAHAYETGDPLTPDQRSYIGGTYGKKTLDAVEHLRAQGRDENLKEPADLTNAILAATGVGDIAALVGKAGAEEAAGIGARLLAKDATGEASEKAASSAVKDAFAKVGAKKTATATAVKQAVKDVEPEAVKVAREKGEAAARAFADRTPESVKVAGKVGAKAASWPIRHPILAPVAFQVPTALVQRKPGALEAGFTGEGTYGKAIGALGDAASQINPVLGEAVSLPAAVLPSAYLAGKAGVNAASGNPQELEKLIEGWKETGLLPKLAEGDVSGALSNLGEHPLYDTLEASGALNAVGRGLGAVARATPGEFGELTRPDLPIRGTGVKVNREYSRDALRQAAQRAYDRTSRGREARADTARGRHYLKEAANRHSSGQEAIRREHAHQDITALKNVLPRRGPRLDVHGHVIGKLDRHSAEVVNLAVERLIQHPGTFNKDLSDYKDLLLKAREARTEDGRPALDRRELKANKELVKHIDDALKRAHPGKVVDAAEAFIKLQEPILHELIDLGLLTKEQAAKASATSFARVHLGAGHDEEIGLVDAKGEPLTLKQIQAEMAERGIQPPGFLSHRAPANSDFYQPSFGGATLEKGGRTGKAVISGSQLGGVETLVRQLRRSRGLVDRARAWNKAVDRFGIEVKGIDTAAEAKKVQADPARYGLDPAVKPTPVPRYPFMARKGEIEGALENQSPAVAEDSAGATLARAIDDAQHDALPKDAKVVFMPEAVVKQLRADAEPSPGGLKAMQAVTTGFKRTVLPFSPSFYIGNGLDNLIRTTLAGVNPAHFALGVKAAHALSAEQRAELLAGAHYASVDAIAPHRSVDAVVTGYDPLSKGVRSFAEWSHRHGWQQAAVKAGPRLFSAFSHYLLTTNALLAEKLPQYGVLGKTVMKDIRSTQGSWAKAITHLDEAVQDFAKGAENPDRMIQLQKDLERVYGNYTRMSPGARKVWSTITPFWLWTRAAYKFVYLTMPANHSIATGFLAATANATRAEREQYGLDKEGKEPVPGYYQGIPLPDGGVLPLANYNSFDYASDPYEAVSSLSVPQIKSVVEALGGKTWKGDEVKGANRAKAALWAAASSFVPLMNDLTEEGEEGSRHLAPHLSLPHPVSAEKVQKARGPWETISIPKSDTESESGGFGGGSSFGEAWADRGEASAGAAFGEAWADR